jgi:hypothetical protein
LLFKESVLGKVVEAVEFAVIQISKTVCEILMLFVDETRN